MRGAGVAWAHGTVYLEHLLSADHFDEAERAYRSVAGTAVVPDSVTVMTFLVQCCSKLRESDARRWLEEYEVGGAVVRGRRGGGRLAAVGAAQRSGELTSVATRPRAREHDAGPGQRVTGEAAGPRACAFMVYMYSHLGRERDILQWFQRGSSSTRGGANGRDDMGYLYGTGTCRRAE